MPNKTKDSFDANKMQYEHKKGDTMQQTFDKLYMNRVLNGDTPGSGSSGAMHFALDNFRASSAFNRAREESGQSSKNDGCRIL